MVRHWELPHFNRRGHRGNQGWRRRHYLRLEQRRGRFHLHARGGLGRSCISPAKGRRARIEHISVGNATNVLAQTTGSNNVYILNSAKTAWTLLAGDGTCADAEIGADGDVWCLDSA